MKLNQMLKKMPGLRVPAFFIAGFAASTIALSATPASAQQATQALPRPTAQPPASQVPVPDQLQLSKMLWSTMLAVDHANHSGNYSVLRDMSSQGFQIANNAANLGQIFSGLRNQQVDLSNALLVPPTYVDAPRMVQDNVLQLRGMFQLRPNAIYFDVYYAWEQGMWKLHGIDIQPVRMLEAMPEGAVPAQNTPQQ